MQIPRRTGDPVFVDRTGGRRRVFVVLGAAGGIVLVLACLALLAGFTGGGPGDLPGLPGSGAGQVQRVAATPTPSTVDRSGSSRAKPPVSSTRASAAIPSSAAVRSAVPATPSASPTSHRNVPTQTPTAHPSKKK
jgi:hypothetical protein